MPHGFRLRHGRWSDPGRIYLVTTVTDKRARVFESFACARLAINCLRQLEGCGWVDSLAYVLMPDHLHWLFSLGRDATLDRVMMRFKGIAARRVNRYRQQSGRLWQPGFHDHGLRAEEDMADVARYVVGNPLRAGLVTSLGDYPHWDAAWL